MIFDQLDQMQSGKEPFDQPLQLVVDSSVTQVNWDYLRLTADSTVGDLPTFEYQVPAETIVSTIDRKLRTEPSLPGVIVTDRVMRTQTVISRRRFFELTGTRYGVAVFMKRQIRTMAKTVGTPLTLMADTPIAEAVAKVLRRDPDLVYEPVLVVHKRQQVKLLDVYTLLLAQSKLFSNLQGELQEINQNLESRVLARTSELQTVNDRLETEIKEKTEIEAHLKVKISYEQTLSRCADALLSEADDPHVIPRTLKILLDTFNVGRAYFLRIGSEEGENQKLHLVSRVTREPNDLQSFTQISLVSVPALTREFWNGKPIIKRHDEINHEHEMMRFLIRHRIKSILMLPVGTAQDKVGVLVFDEPNLVRLWSPDEIELLRTVSSMIYAYIERYRSNLALEKARDRALRANQFKSELLAKVSHELKTPLGAILGYAQLLQLGSYGDLQDSQKEPTDLIINSTNYLNVIVDGLLDQARLDNDNLVLHEAPIQIRQVIKEVATRMQVLAQRKGLQFEVQIARNMPNEIVADRVRLQQIMMNLIGNAVKFTETGFVRVKIWKNPNYEWLMEIEDSGPGISEEAQATIFEPFQQADGSPTRQHRGTGLGLSISHQLIDIMGGELYFESELGKGSLFGFRLPIKTPRPFAAENERLFIRRN